MWSEMVDINEQVCDKSFLVNLPLHLPKKVN